jgi:ribosomal-protein-alanine N-acetyltransferase
LATSRPHTVSSERLDLVLLTPQVLQALVEGAREAASRAIGAVIPPFWPDDHGLRLVSRRLEQLTRDPTEELWLARAMVLRDGQTMVGHIGFHGKPDPSGTVEVGYSVFPEHRRRGYAWEAVNALLAWARAEHGIRRFRASVSPTNSASLELVRKLGMRQVGTQWDDQDGEEHVFLRED